MGGAGIHPACLRWFMRLHGSTTGLGRLSQAGKFHLLCEAVVAIVCSAGYNDA